MAEKQSLTKKVIHICIIMILLIAIAFIALISILRYSEKGEINMPFTISKITIISTVDGKDVENPSFRWEKVVNQNNDIYIYIEKNENYRKTETISTVKLENFQVTSYPKKGKIDFYKQSQKDGILYENIEQNLFQTLEFNGAQTTNSKNQEISNQGGIIEFRCSNSNIGTYQSNEDDQINFKELLKKINIEEESIKTTISFDIILRLDSGKTFKSESIELELPNSNLVEEGTVGKELDSVNNIVFKRIEN